NRRKLLSAQGDFATEGNKAGAQPAPQDQAISPADRLIQLRGLLKSLEVKYTENHPEVKRTKKQIARLEESLAAGNGTGCDTG
ncbi:hypothetical protein ACXWO4_10645, partial [Streptococcus pyogenes]